ncbi:hypothetical protein U9M48_045070 [Paspalum notatum var. saurae]|uniref:DCD domain-containing protein n=1 Tax=Paspalum notatum var. saurae TaxID=547442 RepID=A0AAQ3UWI8_PASNO
MEMERYDDREFWQFSDQLRLQQQQQINNSFSSLSIADSIWSSSNSNTSSAHPSSFPTAAKLAFFGNNAADRRYNNATANPKDDVVVKSYFNKSVGRPASNNNTNSSSNKKQQHGQTTNDTTTKKSSGSSRSFKSLPASEALPRGEAVGGYIFVCNNDTMEENLKRRLFGLPSRYRDSVRAITPGLPLFLYNYSTHQLHGIFEAASFGGSNIDPTAWEDKKCPGESRFPAQVRVATRKICDPLEEDAFRPILHHYDGPKFRLELSVPEALSLLDIFAEKIFA